MKSSIHHESFYQDPIKPKKTIQSDSAIHVNSELKQAINISLVIMFDMETKITIDFKKAAAGHLTCEWLVTEALNRVLERGPNSRVMQCIPNYIGLKTRDGNLAIDYWLTLPQKTLTIFENSMVLVPIYKREHPYRPKGEKICVEDFEYARMICETKFSKIFLVRKLDTGKFYIMKQISRSAYSSPERTVELVMRERDYLIRLKGPYVTQLHYSFQTAEHLYFVMEYAAGGDLFLHMKRIKTLPEAEAKFLAMQVLLALDHVHQNQILYRDLKTENILLDIDGNVKLADFGISKDLQTAAKLSNSFVGTLEYMAPENLEEKPMSQASDYYSFGVLIYELVLGRTPFEYKGSEKSFTKQVLNDKPDLSGLSKNLKDLLSKLLTKKCEKRLGYKKGISEILKHSWFKGVNTQTNNIFEPPIPIDPTSVHFTGRNLTVDDAKTLKTTPSGDKEIAGFSYYTAEPESNNYLKKVQDVLKGKNFGPMKVEETKESTESTIKYLRSKQSENFQEKQQIDELEGTVGVSSKLGKYSSGVIKLPGSFSVKTEGIYAVSAV